MDACAVHSSLWEILEQITENLKSKRLADVFRLSRFILRKRMVRISICALR